jgi:hypothetical protein
MSWFLQIFSKVFLILRRTARDIITTKCWSSCKVPVILWYIKETLIFLTDLKKKLKCQISWNSIQWKPSCTMRTVGRTDGRTGRQADMTKLIVAFCYFPKAPKTHALSELIAMSYRICIFNCVVVALIRRVSPSQTLFHWLNESIFYGIHVYALILKNQENTH